jgi:hypothetical protein
MKGWKKLGLGLFYCLILSGLTRQERNEGDEKILGLFY